jgi:hypothetical protein
MAMSVGYKVSKVHRVAEFKAGFVLRDFINKLYEEKKTLSIEKNELNKALKLDPENEAIKARIAEVECLIVSAKLKLNGLYGSTIINQDRHSETEILDVTETKLLKKRISSLTFQVPVPGRPEGPDQQYESLL